MSSHSGKPDLLSLPTLRKSGALATCGVPREGAALVLCIRSEGGSDREPSWLPSIPSPPRPATAAQASPGHLSVNPHRGEIWGADSEEGISPPNALADSHKM